MVERKWSEVNQRVGYPIQAAMVQLENGGILSMDDEVTKYCVSYCLLPVVTEGLRINVDMWNAHKIEGKLYIFRQVI